MPLYFGIPGDNPLVCFGIIPSTAEPEDLDNTMKSVDRIAKSNGFDSWIMLNIYPQRATSPNDMDVDVNEDICNDNLRYIEEILSEGVVSFGKLSKEGHPHHPLYLKKDEIMKAFDISKYLI